MSQKRHVHVPLVDNDKVILPQSSARLLPVASPSTTLAHPTTMISDSEAHRANDDRSADVPKADKVGLLVF
jgi:hypothetical protein